MIRAFSFLQRNPQSGILNFRYVIPPRYQQVIGKREVKFSLRTAGMRLAIQMARRHYCDIQAQLQTAEGKMAKRPFGK